MSVLMLAFISDDDELFGEYSAVESVAGGLMLMGVAACVAVLVAMVMSPLAEHGSRTERLANRATSWGRVITIGGFLVVLTFAVARVTDRDGAAVALWVVFLMTGCLLGPALYVGGRLLSR